MLIIRSKAVPLLWVLFVIYVSCLSLLCYLICSLQPCDRLLGKAWSLGYLVCCVFLCVRHIPIWCLGSGVILDCIDSWSLPSSTLTEYSFNKNTHTHTPDTEEMQYLQIFTFRQIYAVCQASHHHKKDIPTLSHSNWFEILEIPNIHRRCCQPVSSLLHHWKTIECMLLQLLHYATTFKLRKLW